MKVDFTTETVRLLMLFENVTNVSVKDCFVNGNSVYYIVEEGKIGLAIGKGGNSIKNVERLVGKNIKVYEYSPDSVQFIRNLIPKAKEINIQEEGGKRVVEIRVLKQDRGTVIGRDGEKIKIFKEVLKRMHNISDLRVK